MGTKLDEVVYFKIIREYNLKIMIQNNWSIKLLDFLSFFIDLTNSLSKFTYSVLLILEI